MVGCAQIAGEPDAATMNRIFQWISRNIKRLVAEHNKKNEAAAVTTGEEHEHSHEQQSSANNASASSKLPVAESELKSLSHYATLDTLVTVVDALNLFDILGSIETLADKNNAAQMLGNTGALDKAKQELTAAVKALRLASPDIGTKKTVALIKQQHPHLAANAKQVREVMEEIKETEKKPGDNSTPDIDDRPLSQLMLEQIEFASVIVVSKASILLSQYAASERDGEAELGRIKGLLQKLNPKARVIIPRVDKYGDLDAAQELIGTDLFDMQEASRSAGWQLELAKEEHVPETDEYGISSLVFRAKDMPFHPTRLHSILKGFGSYESVLSQDSANAAAVVEGEGEGELAGTEDHDATPEQPVFQGVVRTKGTVWLANAHSFPVSLHSAGKYFSAEASDMPFRVTMCDKTAHRNQVKAGKWSEAFGDRQSEVVFIGMNLNTDVITEKLTSALLTEEENVALGGVVGWRRLDDPFFDGNCAAKYFDIPAHLQINDTATAGFAVEMRDTVTARIAEGCDLEVIIAEMKALVLPHNAHHNLVDDDITELLPAVVPAILHTAPYEESAAEPSKQYTAALKQVLKQWGGLISAFLKDVQDQLSLLGVVFDWVCGENGEEEQDHSAGLDKKVRMQQVGHIVQCLHEFDVVEAEVSKLHLLA